MRNTTKIQKLAEQILAAAQDDETDYQESMELIATAASEIHATATRMDARTGRIDPRLRRKRKKKVTG